MLAYGRRPSVDISRGIRKWGYKFRLGAFREIRLDLFAIDIKMANSISAKVARNIVPRLQIFHSPSHHPFAWKPTCRLKPYAQPPLFQKLW
tara:strand:- start:28376 stop:28648 length:273 start_codon:yes stop_codon:yes gene_type:complete